MERANFQSYEWKHALENNSRQYPEEHGWIKKDGALVVEWLRQKPAPELMLEFVSCKCKKSKCSNGMCDCFLVGLSCMNVCRWLSCANGTSAQDEELREGNENGSGDDSFDDDECRWAEQMAFRHYYNMFVKQKFCFLLIIMKPMLSRL